MCNPLSRTRRILNFIHDLTGAAKHIVTQIGRGFEYSNLSNREIESRLREPKRFEVG